MTSKWLLLILYLGQIVHQNQSRESLLQCWKCEVISMKSEDPGISLDACQAQFDFTEHTAEDCDGKCWKSIELLDTKLLAGVNDEQRLKLEEKALASLKSSRRCFSADDLIQASEMGINVSNGCRKIKRENEKPKEVCFCSDQEMCNQVTKLTRNIFLHSCALLLLWILNKFV